MQQIDVYFYSPSPPLHLYHDIKKRQALPHCAVLVV